MRRAERKGDGALSSRSDGAKRGWAKRKAKGAKFSGTRQTKKAEKLGALASIIAAGVPQRLTGVSQLSGLNWQDVGAEQRAHIADAERIPGRGEIVGGQTAALADKIAKMARKRGGTDAIQSELDKIERTAEYEANRAADHRLHDSAAAQRRSHDEAVVCAFLAEITGIGTLNGGPLPPTIMVSGFTVARIADALRAAGYTDNGRR